MDCIWKSVIFAVNIITMKERIFEIIYEKFPSYDGDIDLLSDFSNDLAADSLDIIDVVFAVEKEFGITIHEEEINGLNTVGDLVRLVKRKKDV